MGSSHGPPGHSNINTLADTAFQSEGLGPRARVASSFDLGESLTEANGGIGGFCDGELLTWYKERKNC